MHRYSPICLPWKIDALKVYQFFQGFLKNTALCPERKYKQNAFENFEILN